MGVQLRVAAAGVPVIKRNPRHPADIDLRHGRVGPRRSDPGGGDLCLEQPKHISDGRVVDLPDLMPHLRRRQRPQHRHRLRHRERQVIARHRRPGGVGGGLRVRAPQRLTRHGVTALPEQQAQLLLRHPIPDRQLPAGQGGDT